MTKNVRGSINFTSSRLKDLFISELFYLSFEIENKAIALFSKYPITENQGYISADVEGLDLIYSLLSYASKLQELTTNSIDTKLHIDRAEIIIDLLSDLDINELFNKKVRNTIEHFAEYLDKANELHTLYKGTQRYFVAYNLVISHLTPFDSPELSFKVYSTPQLTLPLYPIRIYVPSERRFYNMDWSIDLDALCNEAHLISEYLKALKVRKEDSPEDWISSLTVC